MPSVGVPWSWVVKTLERPETDDGHYLVYSESGRPIARRLTDEWTRVGRSLAADIRFDDSTVSRRHALIALQDDQVRVMDDRSLNGVAVNGRRIDGWEQLSSGDVITIGRHELLFLAVLSGLVINRPVHETKPRLPPEWAAQIGPVWTEEELIQRFRSDEDARGRVTP